ncbi:MAG TPA: NHL repeat-containing protein [Thermomicrobiales bacterium]|nr:NHL repeat-containing protein [Thermomicrobiales bacterium]
MSQDTTVEHHDELGPIPVPPASLLDRPLTMPRASTAGIAAALALVAALLLRFTGLDRWPLTVMEANIAQSAHDIVRGTGGVDHLFGAPAVVGWVSLLFFAGWPADSVARVAMAVAGLLAVVLVLSQRRSLGGGALWGAALIATAPTLIVASRRLDGGSLMVLLTLCVVGCAYRSPRSTSLTWPSLAGVSTALLILSGPLGIPAAALAWLAVLLLFERASTPRAEALGAGAAAGLGTAVLVSTVFLTRPGSFAAAHGELLSRFWGDHLSRVGQQGWLPAFNIILNEPLLVTLALVAVLAAPDRRLSRALAIWFLAAFTLMTLLGDVSVAGYALAVLPLALLAGVGMAHVLGRLPWRKVRRGDAVLYVAAVLLMLAAAISLVGLLTGGTSGGARDWLMQFELVVIVGVLPLSVAIALLGQRLTGDRLVLVLAAALLLLVAVSTRSAVLAASERTGMPGDPLADRATTGGVTVVVERLRRVSRDLTMGQRDAQDPGGGHGLRVAIDKRIQQPFAWYFRDFPNASVFDPDQDPAPAGADIVLLDGTRDGRLVAPGYTGESYPLAWSRPDALHDPDWAGLATDPFRPAAWRAFAAYLINRQPAVAPERHEYQVLAVGPVAERLFAMSGPFNLGDRAGAGSAPGQLNHPRGVAVAPDGSIYVVDSRNARINVYGADGTFLFSFGGEGGGPGQLARLATAGGGGASGIAIDGSGNVFVADTWNHRIQVFAADGTYLFGWGHFYDARDDPAATTQNPGAFYGPRGLALHDGLLFVTDTGNERVQVFQADGQFVTMFGAPGSGDDSLLEPVGIAVSEDGVVFIADSHNARIARYSTSGTWLDPIPVETWLGQQFFEPYVAVTADGRVFASASTAGMVIEIDLDTLVAIPRPAAEMRQPFGVAVSPDGLQLLVTDGVVQAVIRMPTGE